MSASALSTSALSTFALSTSTLSTFALSTSALSTSAFKAYALCALLGLTLSASAEVVPPGSADEIRERLEPFGALCRAGSDCGQTAAPVSSGPQSGEDVYNQFCFACHATGASNAPLFADSEAWQPRIAKGMEVLVGSTLNGLGLMPPRGACMSCSDDELGAAVQFMVDQVP